MTDKALPIVIAATYKFVRLPDFESLRDPLLQKCQALGVVGTLLLAEEGINGTVAGTRAGIDQLFAELRREPRFADLTWKESYTNQLPFHRLKVKFRREIVTMGVPGIDPIERTGEHVNVEKWNELLQDPEVVVIDTRNQYEHDIGTFRNAISPETVNFREFPQYVQDNLDPKQNPKIAMFCTGGIRCEKASAYLLELGFAEVYQLNGGILKYLEEVTPEESLWEGECFVFDSRVAVNEELEPGSYVQCFACRHPLSEEECESEEYEPGISCPHCLPHQTQKQRQSFEERQRQIQLAKERFAPRQGDKDKRRQGEFEA